MVRKVGRGMKGRKSEEGVEGCGWDGWEPGMGSNEAIRQCMYRLVWGGEHGSVSTVV